VGKENVSWEDFLKELETEDTIMHKIKRGIRRVFRYIPENYRTLKHFIIRGKRGWSKRDVWSLDYYLAKIISESVEYLNEIKHGWPGDEVISWEDYGEELNKIVRGFKHYMEDPELESDCCSNKYCFPGKCPILKEGFDTLIKWFPTLWD
jgi:hypothetical protein